MASRDASTCHCRWRPRQSLEQPDDHHARTLTDDLFSAYGFARRVHEATHDLDAILLDVAYSCSHLPNESALITPEPGLSDHHRTWTIPITLSHPCASPPFAAFSKRLTCVFPLAVGKTRIFLPFLSLFSFSLPYSCFKHIYTRQVFTVFFSFRRECNMSKH